MVIIDIMNHLLSTRLFQRQVLGKFLNRFRLSEVGKIPVPKPWSRSPLNALALGIPSAGYHNNKSNSTVGFTTTLSLSLKFVQSSDLVSLSKEIHREILGVAVGGSKADTHLVRSGDKPLDDDFFSAFDRLEQATGVSHGGPNMSQLSQVAHVS